jgi:hypothetical protein
MRIPMVHSFRISSPSFISINSLAVLRRNSIAVILITIPVFSVLLEKANAAVGSGSVMTVAGNGVRDFQGDGGPATNAALKDPFKIAFGTDATLYIGDSSNYRIRSVSPLTGVISTVAGNGVAGSAGDGLPATNVSLGPIQSIAVDGPLRALYLADLDNYNVYKVNLTNGIITRFAGVGIFNPFPPGQNGDGGAARGAYCDGPQGLAVDQAHNVYISELGSTSVRKVDFATGKISTIAGHYDPFHIVTSGDGGPASAATFTWPYSVALDKAGNLFIADAQNGQNSRIRRIDAVSGIIRTIAGGGTNFPGSGPATNMIVGSDTLPDIAVSQSGVLYISERNRVLQVNLASGLLSPFAGSTNAGFSGDGGPATDALFQEVYGLAVPPGGGLAIVDDANQRIRYVAPSSITLTNDPQQTAVYL